MAKNGQLWDDSALVKALDDAISKYKIMHVKDGVNGYLEEEKITKDTEESIPNVINDNNEAKSAPYVETDNITVTENCTSEDIDQHEGQSNGNQIQDSDYTNANAESAEQYNLLLNQYNAVEEQRQNLLQQLYQYGYWDPQSYSYGYNYGYGYSAGYDSQYNTAPAPQTSEPLTCSCRPYVCPYSTSLAHNGSSVSVEDESFIKAAMGAVEKTIHSSDKETSGINDVNKEGKKEEEGVTKSQTDLSVVMNAWFSAGFYTGKYLSEQASTKK